MQKQIQKSQEFSKNSEINQADTLHEARQTVRNLVNEPTFLASAPSDYDMSSSSTDDYLYHIARYTDDFAETRIQDGTLDESKLAPLLLASFAPYAMRQQELLNSSIRLDRENYHHAKDTMADFNGLVFEIIDKNEDLTVNDIATTIALTSSEYSNDRMEKTLKSATDIARGIRTERAFEKIIKDFGVLDIRRATPKEDRKGIDFIVTTPAGNELKIDIKSSLDQVASRNKGYDNISAFTKTSDGKFVFYPLITDEMFENNTCKLQDTEYTQQVSLAVMSQLQQMETNLLQKR